MKQVPNDIVTNLIRHLPLILDNVDAVAVKNNLRLDNAIRLTRISIKKLSKINKHGKENRD